MQCNICPLFSSWNNESDSGEDCVRLDATENNKDQIKKFLNGDIEKMHIGEYLDTKTEESLKEVLSVADAVCM